MSDKRIVMRVEVLWVTEDPNSSVEFAFRQYDETGKPSPVDLVAAAMQAALVNMDWSIVAGDRPEVGDRGFEMRVDGPGKWSIAFDNEDTRADVEGDGPADRHASGNPGR